MNDGRPAVMTIGHSTLSADAFIQLLRAHGVRTLVDVRSAPYARYAVQFNQPDLRRTLGSAGVNYVYMGRELGGRPYDPTLYDDAGHVRYDLLAQQPGFLRAVACLQEMLAREPVAVMCSEEDPKTCHRHLLLGRVLTERGVEVRHIRADGSVVTEQELLRPASGQLLLPGFEEEEACKSTRSASPVRARSSSSRR